MFVEFSADDDDFDSFSFDRIFQSENHQEITRSHYKIHSSH